MGVEAHKSPPIPTPLSLVPAPPLPLHVGHPAQVECLESLLRLKLGGLGGMGVCFEAMSDLGHFPTLPEYFVAERLVALHLVHHLLEVHLVLEGKLHGSLSEACLLGDLLSELEELTRILI